MKPVPLSQPANKRHDFGLRQKNHIVLSRANEGGGSFGFVYRTRKSSLHGGARILAQWRAFAELLGLWEQAAQEYESRGDWPKAAECYRKAGLTAEAGRLFETAGLYPEAAEAFREAGLPDQAARCLIKIGDLEAAWTLLRAGDRGVGAKLVYQHLQARPEYILPSGVSEELAEALEDQGELAWAAELWHRAGHPEKAAPLLETLGRYDEAIELYRGMGENVTVARLQEAAGHYADAAATYEQVAATMISENATGTDVARLLLAAATCYSRIGMTVESKNAEEKALMAGKLPKIDVRLSAEKPLRVNEWDSVEIWLDNRGYGPAREIRLELRGPLASPVSRSIVELPAGGSEHLTVPLKVTEAGRVPFEFQLSYRDGSGEQQTRSILVPIRVLQPAEFQPPQTWQFFLQSTIGSLIHGPVDQSQGKVESGGIRVEGDAGMVKQVKEHAQEPFRFCPYCGKTFDLPKTPRYCPYCGEQLLV